MRDLVGLIVALTEANLFDAIVLVDVFKEHLGESADWLMLTLAAWFLLRAAVHAHKTRQKTRTGHRAGRTHRRNAVA